MVLVVDLRSFLVVGVDVVVETVLRLVLLVADTETKVHAILKIS